MEQVAMEDVDELWRFIDTLQRFNAELANRVSSLRGHWGQLGDVWKDQQYDRFAGDWEDTLKIVDTYLRDAPDFVSHLQEKARIIEDFQD